MDIGYCSRDYVAIVHGHDAESGSLKVSIFVCRLSLEPCIICHRNTLIKITEAPSLNIAILLEEEADVMWFEAFDPRSNA